MKNNLIPIARYPLKGVQRVRRAETHDAASATGEIFPYRERRVLQNKNEVTFKYLETRSSEGAEGATKGLTLIELLIGLTISALILAFAYEGLNKGISILKDTGSFTDTKGAAAAGLDMLAKDLRCAFVSQYFHDPVKSFLSTTFIGYPDRLCFFTNSGEGFSVHEVEYFVENGLKRRYKKIPDGGAGQGGQAEDVCGAVRSMSISYFDGRVWRRTWGLDKNTGLPVNELGTMPFAVEISIVIGKDGDDEMKILAPLMCGPFTGGIM